MHPICKHFARGVVAGLMFLALPEVAHGQTTYTWNGGGTSDVWSDGDNWAGGASPASSLDTALVFAGTTRLTNSNDLGGGVATTLLNSITFDSTAGSFNISGDSLTFLNNTTSSGPTIIQNSSSAVALANNIALTNSLTYQGNGSATLSGVISETASGMGLTKSGSGTLTLSNSNSYSGGTTINGGILNVSADANLGAVPSPAATNITFDGGTLQFGASFNPSNNRRISLSSGGGTIDTNGFNVSIGTIISGSGSLTKLGNGILTLSSGSNSYSGATKIQGGSISVSIMANGGTNSRLGSSSNAASNLVLNGGTLRYAGGGHQSDRLFSVGTSGGTIESSGSGGLDLNNTGSMGFNGQTGARTLTLTGTSTGDNTLAAAIGDNSGATSLAKSGDGKWILSGNSSYTGGTTVSAGTLTVSSTTGLGASSSSLAVNNPNTGAGTNVVVNLASSGGTAIGSLSGTIGTPSSGTNTVTINLGTSQSLTVNQTTAATYAGVLAGSGSSLILGSSSTSALTLTGANTYDGGTTINAGTLLVANASGSATGGGTVTVESGGTLGGNNAGEIGPVVVKSGGTLAPGLGGTTTGQLKVGNTVTLESGSAFNLQITGTNAGSEFDQLFLTGGNTSLAGTLSVAFSTFTPAGTEALFIINNTGGGTMSGTFSNYTTSGATVANYGGFDWKIYYGHLTDLTPYGGSSNDAVLVASTPVPEPAHIMLVCGAAGALGAAARRRWRRRQSALPSA